MKLKVMWPFEPCSRWERYSRVPLRLGLQGGTLLHRAVQELSHEI